MCRYHLDVENLHLLLPCRLSGAFQRSSANAPVGGLKPPPEGRLRRAKQPPSLLQHRSQQDHHLPIPPASCVRVHNPTGGHHCSPLVAIRSPHSWPSFLPTGDAGRGSGQGPHPLAGGRSREPSLARAPEIQHRECFALPAVPELTMPMATNRSPAPPAGSRAPCGRRVGSTTPARRRGSDMQALAPDWMTPNAGGAVSAERSFGSRGRRNTPTIRRWCRGSRRRSITHSDRLPRHR